MIDLENLYEQAQKQSQQMSGGGNVKNPNILNCNRKTTIYFKLTPSFDSEGKAKISKPFGVYNFKLTKSGRRYYAGTAPSSLGLDDVIIQKRNEHFNNGEKDVGARMYPEARALYSIFVISDSDQPENNAKFMVLNTGNKEKSEYGKGSPFRNFIEDAKSDPDEPKSLNDIYSMGDVDLRIRMDIDKTDSGIPDITYKWVRKVDENPFSKVDDIAEFFKKNALDLDQEVEQPKSDEELLSLYRKHILGVTVENETRVDAPSLPSGILGGGQETEEDDIPMKDEDFSNLKTGNISSSNTSSGDDDPELEKLLAEMPDLEG